ncbi:MAG TPA: MraY family glycosyltransferase [Planctomycetota bacterium]|nr:MraY family glycosyltransferase [Planctomycetota bacterium]
MTHLQFSDVVWYALAFLTALGLVLFVTPLTIQIANAFRIQDTPDGRLKKHTRTTPYLGGLAVAAGFVIAFSLLSTPSTLDYRGLGILAGGFMMVLLGLYDDLVNLRPSVKFLGQLLAAVVLYKAGVSVQLVALDWWGNLALTVLWITGVTNAFNIIDVMDGLASGVACIAALFLFLISALSGQDPLVPFLAITLAGALVGFLRFNVMPARIFLGDTGSLFIGFMMAAMSMLVSYSGHNRFAVLTPVVLLAVPIFDTVFVAFHRARRGIPFFRGSPDHFALRVSHAGAGVRRTVLGTWRACLLLGVVALLMVFGPHALVPWLLGATAVCAAIAFVVLSRMPPPGRSPSPARPARMRTPVRRG